MLSHGDTHTYVEFVYRALVPCGGVDQFFAQNRAAIDRAAVVFRELFEFKSQPLYRGILLDPVDAETGKLAPVHKVRYLSFSESKNVALEFADINERISRFIRQRTPHFRGYLICYTPDVNEVLFHHSWADRLGFHKLPLPNWDSGVVREQREVLLRQEGRIFDVVPVVGNMDAG